MLAVYLQRGRVEVRHRPRPRRPEGFALVRMLRAGICNTDLELRRGYYGFRGIPGHEFAGEVVESDDRSLRGRLVVGEINLGCGACEWCARELGRHCPTRQVLGIVRQPGSFQEYFVLPERNLHRVPDTVTVAEAVFTEPLAAACEILDQVRIPRGAAVAVLGDGKLGLLIGQVLKLYGAEVHQYGRHKAKLRLAESCGIETRSERRFPERSYDWVVDATGTPGGLRQAVRMARPRGTIVLKSTVHGMVEIDTAGIIVNEITLVGSRCGRFEPALELLRDRKVRVDPMVSETIPLEKAPRAFARAEEAGVLKILLRPPG